MHSLNPQDINHFLPSEVKHYFYRVYFDSYLAARLQTIFISLVVQRGNENRPGNNIFFASFMRGSKVSARLCFYVTLKASIFHNRAVLCSGTVLNNHYYLLDCFSPHLLLVICLKSASNSKELYLNPVFL